LLVSASNVTQNLHNFLAFDLEITVKKKTNKMQQIIRENGLAEIFT